MRSEQNCTRVGPFVRARARGPRGRNKSRPESPGTRTISSGYFFSRFSSLASLSVRRLPPSPFFSPLQNIMIDKRCVCVCVGGITRYPSRVRPQRRRTAPTSLGLREFRRSVTRRLVVREYRGDRRGAFALMTARRAGEREGGGVRLGSTRRDAATTLFGPYAHNPSVCAFAVFNEKKKPCSSRLTVIIIIFFLRDGLGIFGSTGGGSGAAVHLSRRLRRRRRASPYNNNNITMMIIIKTSSTASRTDQSQKSYTAIFSPFV